MINISYTRDLLVGGGGGGSGISAHRDSKRGAIKYVVRGLPIY